jgi:hypothetical protein
MHAWRVNSDEDMFITQNVFRQADSDNNLDLLHKILFGEERLQQQMTNYQQCPLQTPRKVRKSYYQFLAPSLKKNVLIVYERVQNTTQLGRSRLERVGRNTK